jgi:hypothetical protein
MRASTGMKKRTARDAIVAEWRQLPADKRATAHQASSFAMQAIERYKWTSGGDPYLEAMFWLSRHIGEP